MNLFVAIMAVCVISPVLTAVAKNEGRVYRSAEECVLPPQLVHGKYEAVGLDNQTSEHGYQSFLLNVTCDPGYAVVGKTSVYCVAGIWSSEMPECVHSCRLKQHPSVEYLCYTDNMEGTRPCNEQEPSGTVVRPQCRAPNYYYSGVLNHMRCNDGTWDYVAICNPECGLVTPEGESLTLDGRPNPKTETLPWHAVIYRKTTTPYQYICGGSIISPNIIISAAHCFSSDLDVQPSASNYAVALGKVYRPWNDSRDAHVQKFDVNNIKIPNRYQGLAANYQADISIVVLGSIIEYTRFIRPVCIDFDLNFDTRQLTENNIGKVPTWGPKDKRPAMLTVVDLRYIDIVECIHRAAPEFRPFITSDKICAAGAGGTADCDEAAGVGRSLVRGDGGGGLVFTESALGKQRYYLRGIVSTAPKNDHDCNQFSLTSFTQLVKHEHFIKEFARL